MFKYSITIGGNSLAELRASAAAFAGATEPAPPSIAVNVSETGGLSAATETDDDGGAADTNAPEFDSAGIPWDERIHAGTKGRNQDGTWKRRRNTSDVQFASVMAELSARKAGQQPSAPPAVAAAPAAAPVTANPDPMAASPVVIPSAPAPMVPAAPMAPAANVAPVPAPAAAPAPAIPAAPAAPVAATPAPVAAETASPAAPPAAGGGMQFAVFMPKFAAALNSGRFSQDDLKGYLQSWGLTDIGQISTDPIKVEQFYNWLRSAQPPLID